MTDENYFWLGDEPDSLNSTDSLSATTEPQDSHKPTDRARETIQDLKAGRIPRQVVRDLGEAVREADRNHSVGDAIGRSINRIGDTTS